MVVWVNIPNFSFIFRPYYFAKPTYLGFQPAPLKTCPPWAEEKFINRSDF